MPEIYKIATLNINGMATPIKIEMLQDFLQKQDTDIIPLQEVTRPIFDDIRGFTAHTNIGTTGRGTTILTRDHIQFTDIECLHTGSGMAAVFENVTIVNTYAPSEAERRDRENFFSNELPYLLRGVPQSILVGGDFNSVLTNLDATGRPNYSRALNEFIRGFDLVDMWEMSQDRPTYTHYTSRGASRIDKIYASRNMSRQKRDAETRIEAFTDHLPVVIRIDLEATTMRRGRSYWKMNTAFLRDESLEEQLRQRWTEWSKLTKHYPTLVMWWERVAKMHIKKFFIHEGTVKRREETQMENFYYACLYDILQRPMQHAEKKAKLNHLQAKIVKLHNARLERGQIELRSPDIFQKERMSLFQLIKRRERRGKREISRVQERESGWQTPARNIVRLFSEHMRNKYCPIQVDEDCVRRMLETEHGSVPEEGRDMLEIPITTEELKAAVYKGDSKNRLAETV